MLWLLVVLLIGGLSFVIFHKPHVNAMGAGWTPPPSPPATATSSADVAEDAVTLRLARRPASQVPDTFDVNELLVGAVSQSPADRPHV